uniref:Uncharacterized protein n=1 Tax=Triticum urartu TaxID=4572 RepID=A0A8R7TKI8_TRIUA
MATRPVFRIILSMPWLSPRWTRVCSLVRRPAASCCLTSCEVSQRHQMDVHNVDLSTYHVVHGPERSSTMVGPKLSSFLAWDHCRDFFLLISSIIAYTRSSLAAAKSRGAAILM